MKQYLLYNINIYNITVQRLEIAGKAENAYMYLAQLSHMAVSAIQSFSLARDSHFDKFLNSEMSRMTDWESRAKEKTDARTAVLESDTFIYNTFRYISSAHFMSLDWPGGPILLRQSFYSH